MLDGQLRCVRTGGVAEMHVTGAVRHVHDGVVGERVVRIGHVEDPSVGRGTVVNAPVVERRLAVTGERAHLGGPTGTAAVEVEHHLGRVGAAFPEGELAAVGTLAVAAGHDLLPTGGVAGLGGRATWLEDRLAGLAGRIHR